MMRFCVAVFVAIIIGDASGDPVRTFLSDPVRTINFYLLLLFIRNLSMNLN